MTGPELRNLRKSLNLTLVEFTQRLGLSPKSWGHVQRMETGKIPISKSIAMRLKLYFNVGESK